MPDVRILNDGALNLLRPVTHAGRAWLRDNTSAAWKWLRGSLAVDVRYTAPIVDCMLADGLQVEIDTPVTRRTP